MRAPCDLTVVGVGILQFFSPRWMIGPVWVYPRADQAAFGRGEVSAEHPDSA